MKHLGDIKNINGAEIEPVDIITFGSPCQNLSIAGKRDGLEGKQSSLFYQAVRIIREMRDATNGVYPRFAIWENVPGAFSSNRGQDFRAVLEEITESEIPMPTSGKWATAGMVRGNRRSVAWRTLDAQFFGVPQRRRRIFLITDFTGQCAAEILSEQQGLSGHLAESGEAGQEVAAGVGAGANKQSSTAYVVVRGFGGDIVRTLTARHDSSPCIDRGQDLVFAVRTAQTSSNGHGITEEKAYTLDGAQGQCISQNYTVRRLTVIECLRLQGFPDWWFDGVPGYSDTQGYKAVGNSIAVPCVSWIMGRVAVQADSQNRRRGAWLARGGTITAGDRQRLGGRGKLRYRAK